MTANPYETEKLLEEYLLLHYGAPETVLPWAFGPREALDFPARCVTEQVTPVDGAHALESPATARWSRSTRKN